MPDNSRTNARLPLTVACAATALVVSVACLMTPRLEFFLGVPLEDYDIRDGGTAVMLVGILACFILRGELWARHLATLVAVIGAGWLLLPFFSHAINKSALATASFFVVSNLLIVGGFLMACILLYIPPASAWFHQRRAVTSTSSSNKKQLIPWVTFFLALGATYLTYWEIFTFEGTIARAPRSGFFAFGLVAASAGFYLYCILLARPKPDKAGSSKTKVAIDVALACLVFLISLLFPAKSLSYLALLTFPLQLLGAFFVAVVIMQRRWLWLKQHRAYLAIYMLGLLAVMFPWLFVMRVAIEGIH